MNYTPKQVAARLFGGRGHVTSRTLQKLNVAAAVALVAQAAAVLVLSAAYVVAVYLSHLTGDALQTKLHGTEVTAPALHELWHFNLAYAAAAALLVTAVAYALAATVWRARYDAWLKKDMQPLRWLVTAVAGSLLLITLALAAGVNEFTDLKSIVAFVLLASLSAAWLELQPLRRGKLDAASWIRLAIGVVAAVAPWLIVLGTMLATDIFGSVGVPGYIWLLYVTLAAGWFLAAGNMYLSRRKRGKWDNYLNAEAWHIGLVLVIETAFVWELFAAVLHP